MTGRWRMTPMNRAFHLLGKVVNTNACVMFTFDGRLDEARLRQAVAHALRRHPLTNCQVVEDEAVPGWQPASGELPIDFRCGRLATDEQAAVEEALYRNVWGEPSATVEGRPVRFHLTETPNRTFFQIVSPHSCTDAQAAVRLGYDVADCYSALERGALPEPGVIDVVRRDVHRAILDRLPWFSRLWHALRAATLIVADLVRQDVGFALPDQPVGKTQVRFLEFGEEVTERLRGAARARGVSVHALFCLAVLRVRQGFNRRVGRWTGRWFRGLDQISLRRFAPEPMDDLFDVVSIPYSLRMHPRWSDEQVLRSVTEQVQRLRDGGIHTEIYRMMIYTALSRVLPVRWLVTIVTRFVGKSNVLITNPGIMSHAVSAFGSVPVAAYSTFPPLMPPSRLALLFMTYQRKLRVLAVYDLGAFPLGLEEDLLRPLGDELLRLAGPGTGTGPRVLRPVSNFASLPQSHPPPSGSPTALSTGEIS